MLRTLTLTTVTTLGLLVPLAAAPAAGASPPQEAHYYPLHHYHQRYHVMYRKCGCPIWECYGTYPCHEEAEHAAYRLRSRGFEVRIR